MDLAVNLLTNNLVQIEYYNKFQVIGLANLSGNFYLLYILIFVPYKKHWLSSKIFIVTTKFSKHNLPN